MEYEEELEDYEGEVEFGEDAEYETDENKYEKAFEKANEIADLEVTEEADDEKNNEKVEYEYDEIVGARDKKPIMSKLNQRILDKYEMDDLLNQI